MSTNNAANNVLGNQILLTASVNLSSADILGLFASPKVVVASPGVGKLIKIDFWVVSMFFNTTQYAAGGNLQLRYTTSGNVLSSIIGTTNITSSSSQIGVTNISNTAIPLANMSNNGISISNTIQAFTTGNSTGRIQIWYSVLDAV